MQFSKIVVTLGGAVAVVFVLTASECKQTTEFVPYVAEICNDNLDNDGNGLIDCKDPACGQTPSCQVSLVLNAVPQTITSDTLTLSGTATNAVSIAVSILPSGTGGTTTPSGGVWQFKLTNLLALDTYNVTLIGTDAQNNHDTLTATFTRNK